MAQPRVLALMAHPDDAELLCAGALIRLSAAGWEVHIATLTAGDCGTTSESPQAITARRAAESAAAAAMIGATCHCLDERDALVVYDKPTLHKTIDLFRHVAPQLIFAHSPLDYMMDHVVASQLARGASFIYAAPNASALPVREDSCVPHLYFCDVLEGIDSLGKPIQPSIWVDIGAQLEKKAEMLACHQSQRDWLLVHHGTDEYIDAMRRHATRRGREAGVAAAEAFVQHRGHAYPKNDLLAELFPEIGPKN
jgi:LmbE family N-acetylglucosaminyl deacetylase